MTDDLKSATHLHMKWRNKEAAEMPPAPPPQVASKRIAAGVLGILLGCLGIHKFLLGYRTPGLIMLLVSLLSVGFAAPVMGLIGLIEGILYLVKSDADFVATYQVGRRGWF